MTQPPLVTFPDAERIGWELHARWELMAGSEAPMDADDLAWADMVQFVLRRASELTRERGDD